MPARLIIVLHVGAAIQQKVRKMGFPGFAKNTGPTRASQLKDEDWLGVFSYMFALYEPSMTMDAKNNSAAAQKQAMRCVVLW